MNHIRARIRSVTHSWRDGCLCALLLTLVAGSGGCKKDTMGGPRLETVPVTGKVLVDGKPVENIAVMFLRAKAKGVDFGVPDPEGSTDANGVLKVGTYYSDDGAIPGDYKLVFIWGELNTFTGEMDGDRFKGKYLDFNKTPFEVTIPEVEGDEPYDIGTFQLETN